MAEPITAADDSLAPPETVPFHNRSTGFRLFLILSLALLPLGLIAFLATLQSSRTADLEKQAQMRIALNESARQIAASLASDISLSRVTMRARVTMPEDQERCPRFREIFSAQSTRMPSYALFDASWTPWCTSGDFSPPRPATIGLAGQRPTSFAIHDKALVVTLADQGANFAGVLRYSDRVLAESGAPGAASGHYGLSLVARDGELALIELQAVGGVAGYQTMSAPIGGTGLSVEMTTVRTPFTAVELVSFFLPIAMWAAAALIAWLVVDRILIRPLRQLERSVSRYQPDEVVTPPRLNNSAALEIRQLASTFGGFIETISTHDAELAAGLARQTRLTREVHHRVKNNLQVVASLINLHARGQTASEVVHAYASIQRRVDALAVVHRNHYAELEENRGVSLRSLVGELAQNIRGSVPEGEPAPPIALDICGCYASQDVAVPVAFLLTELIELSLLTDPRAPISVQLVAMGPGRAQLSVTSAALSETPELAARMENRFARVLEGLSRQLRSPLGRDPLAGRFSLEISIVGEDDAK